MIYALILSVLTIGANPCDFSDKGCNRRLLVEQLSATGGYYCPLRMINISAEDEFQRKSALKYLQIAGYSYKENVDELLISCVAYKDLGFLMNFVQRATDSEWVESVYSTLESQDK